MKYIIFWSYVVRETSTLIELSNQSNLGEVGKTIAEKNKKIREFAISRLRIALKLV